MGVLFVRNGFELLMRGKFRYMLAGILVIEALVIASFVAYVHATHRLQRDQKAFNFEIMSAQSVSKPIVDPTILKSTETTMRPEDLVIGINISGHSRAYRLTALDHPTGHMINDLIGTDRVLVTYCNLSQCIRTYTNPGSSVPLDAEVVGLLNSEMVVKLQGNMYFQRSGLPLDPSKNPPPIPFDALSSTLTTWKDWINHHPYTDVYDGAARPNQAQELPVSYAQ